MKLEGFNLKRELEEGRWADEKDTFVFNERDELKATTDRWLDEVDKGSLEAKLSAADIAKLKEQDEEAKERARGTSLTTPTLEYEFNLNVNN